VSRFLVLAAALVFVAFVAAYVAHLPAPMPVPAGTLTEL
jgi:hypothetical protein